MHLRRSGDIVADAVKAAGGVPREFNTIAVDDGIAMGHGGMLYSLPSRDLIADSVEYMVNAHCADALVCISNCDKITPGMLIAALRLNIPTVFVSGGPMEGGHRDARRRHRAHARRPHHRDRRRGRRRGLRRRHRADRGGRLPDLRLVLGHVHRELDELPDRGARARAARQRLDPRHARRPQGALRGRRAARRGDRARATTSDDDESVLPRSDRHARGVRERDDARRRHGRLDQHLLHLLAAAQEAELDFTMGDIDELSRRVPCLCKVAPNGDVPHGGRPPRRRHPGDPRRAAPRRAAATRTSRPCTRARSTSGSAAWDIRSGSASAEALEVFHAAPGCKRSATAFSQSERWESLDTDAAEGCIRDVEHAYSADGGLAILYGNLAVRGSVVKTAGVDESILDLQRARPWSSSRQDDGRRR